MLTGAGVSTDSGIPDYRGPDAVQRRGNPIGYQEFRRSTAARRRYWARSAIGWPHIAAARPNLAHRVVAELQRQGAFGPVVTQNVDKLHQAAGSRTVIDLHGTLAEAVCLACGALEARSALQHRILRANPDWITETQAIAPDGDIELNRDHEAAFRVPKCLHCGGPLKPNVVLFGETVPRERVERAFRLLSSAGCLVALGSSLTVFSGYRFVLKAHKLGIPIVILNDGRTRADEICSLKVTGRLSALLPTLRARLDHVLEPRAGDLQQTKDSNA